MASLYNKGMLFWIRLFKDINPVKQQKQTTAQTATSVPAIDRYDDHNMDLINAFTEMAMKKIKKELQLCQMKMI